MNDDLLIQRYLDGKLSHAELAALHQRLREDAALREHLRTISEQAVAFGDMVRREADTLVCAPIKTPDKSVWSTLALAACAALLATSAWFFLHSTPSPVVTLIEQQGSVAWKKLTSPEGTSSATLRPVAMVCSPPVSSWLGIDSSCPWASATTHDTGASSSAGNRSSSQSAIGQSVPIVRRIGRTFPAPSRYIRLYKANCAVPILSQVRSLK